MENFKLGYSFNAKTNELMGQEIVYLEKATGKYPHAKNVTFARPPVLGEHEAAVYIAETDSWKKVTDHRGQVWYKTDGTPGGIVEDLGDDCGILKEPPEPEPNIVIAWDDNKKDWTKNAAPGYVFDGEKLREMTFAEVIEAGLEKLPDGYKIENGEVIEKTKDELLTEGSINVSEYNEWIRQKREAEYQASTDKIGLMVLRGEATMEEWQAAIQAVKEQFPYKEDIK